MALDETQRDFTRRSRQMQTATTFRAKKGIEPFLRFLEGAQPGPILDLACGPGNVSAELAKSGMVVTGFDATGEMLQAARARCQKEGLRTVQFRQGEASKLPFEAGSFAGAVTRLSIHHFESPLKVLTELRRVLRSERRDRRYRCLRRRDRSLPTHRVGDTS